MRIVAISDTHGMHNDLVIPLGDVLVHAGDMTLRGKMEEVKEFHAWLERLPHKHKIVIAGNHDWPFEKDPEESRKALSTCHYLEDSSVTIEGIKFYGSPWQPWFMNWAFNLPRGEALKAKWKSIPVDTDVLITHGPPHGILDKVLDGSHVGCEELTIRLKTLNVKAHIFGHIHEDYGSREINGCSYVNASICNSRYLPFNKPIVIDV